MKSTITPAEIERIGWALYGARWQAEMARQLGVLPTTVNRWYTGKRRPMRYYEDKIRSLGGSK